MDNKELDEILQKYAESTRSDKEVAFKKLREKPQEVKRVSKRFKPQYAFVLSLCIIVVVLSIALPITLTSNPTTLEPTFCDSINIEYDEVESILVLINNFGINAYFPILNEDGLTVYSITSQVDSNLHGAFLSSYLECDLMILVQLAIVPKTHILETYEDYFTLPNEQKWKEYDICYYISDNSDIGVYDMQIYFTDGNYDYFVTASSDVEIEATDLLDFLYS